MLWVACSGEGSLRWSHAEDGVSNRYIIVVTLRTLYHTVYGVLGRRQTLILSEHTWTTVDKSRKGSIKPVSCVLTYRSQLQYSDVTLYQSYLSALSFSIKKPQLMNVCVCVFSSHPFWTSMDVPAGVTQEEGHTGFLIHLPSAVRALIFVARRIQPFLSLVDREVEFCVLTN